MKLVVLDLIVWFFEIFTVPADLFERRRHSSYRGSSYGDSTAWDRTLNHLWEGREDCSLDCRKLILMSDRSIDWSRL